MSHISHILFLKRLCPLTNTDIWKTPSLGRYMWSRVNILYLTGREIINMKWLHKQTVL